MPKFTTPAIVKAVRTFDATPEVVAAALQGHMNELLAQGYEV